MPMVKFVCHGACMQLSGQ